MSDPTIPEKTGPEGRRALVMDDQAEVCNLVVAQLGRLGWAASGATSRDELSTALHAPHPSVIILDLSLGETDAIEIFDLLSAQGYRGPVILMSGHPGPVIDHARRIGERTGLHIGGTLRKPFRMHDLRSAIGKLTLEREIAAPVAVPCARRGLLRRALDRDWLEIWFQPKIRLESGLIEGAECLARIRHPKEGILFPAAFLDTATDGDLDQLLLRGVTKALDCAEEFPAGGPPLDFCVNIPGRSITRPGLIERLRSLRENRREGCSMTLELTETDLVEDSSKAETFATQAVLQGFRLSIDDFGNGYATFDRLRSIPFNELKLDKNIVQGCARDSALRSMCRAAVTLAHGFEAMAVAEGVESQEDLEMVRELGFDMAQGFVFAAAMPMDSFVDFASGTRPHLPVPSVAERTG